MKMSERDRYLLTWLSGVLKNKGSVYEIGIFNNWVVRSFDEDQLVEFFNKRFNDNLVRNSKVAVFIYEEEDIVIEVKSVSGLLKINLYDYKAHAIKYLNT